MAEEAGAIGVKEATAECEAVVERVEEAVVVERSVLTAILAAVVARGHVLLEDVPGTGKTVTARVLAEALGLDFQRIQFTPDLLPSDVTGSNVYNEHEKTFEFAEGPIFANVVLADEINRAPPKTQAALLEAMEERQVSVDGTTHELPEPFIVVATQNPVEQEGTFRLPEAQRDRFLVKTSIGYPQVEGEMDLLDKRANRETIAPSVEPAIDRDTVLALQALAEDVTVEENVRRYIVELARYTRTDARTEIGVSPRGVQRVFEATRAAAVIAGRDYVTPDDVKRIAVVAMAHRLVMTTEATVEGVRPVEVIRDALEVVDVPAVSPEAPESADEEGAVAGEGEGRDGGDGGGGRGGSTPPAQPGGEPTPANARPRQGADRRGGDRDGGQPSGGQGRPPQGQGRQSQGQGSPQGSGRPPQGQGGRPGTQGGQSQGEGGRPGTQGGQSRGQGGSNQPRQRNDPQYRQSGGPGEGPTNPNRRQGGRSQGSDETEPPEDWTPPVEQSDDDEDDRDER